MSEDGWGSDLSETGRKKKSLPTWVWGCGLGCGLFLILAVVGLWIAFEVIGEAFDQEAQWESIAEVLPCEEPPAGVHVIGFPIRLGGMQTWIMTDEAAGVQAVLMHAPADSEAADARGELLDPGAEESVGGPMGEFGRHDVEAGTVTVQGRELPCVRYTAYPREGSDGGGSFLKKSLEGATIVVDLGPSDSDELLVMILTQQGRDARVEDDELREFLEPFGVDEVGDRAGPQLEEPAPEEPVTPVDPVPEEGR